MKSSGKSDRGSSKKPADAWQDFIQAELKLNSNVGKAFEKGGFAGFENQTLTFYFEDETSAKTARGQIERLKNKLPPDLRPCDRVNCKVGKVAVVPQITPSSSSNFLKQRTVKVGNPLQSLNFAAFGDDGKGNELSQPVLAAAVQAEESCNPIYTKLCQRTKLLAGGEDNTILVSFGWRLRVGGTRGFRELLLPVFHPVFGVPYIPASSLKGAARAWARQSGESGNEICKILGILDGKVAQAAKVEILDAFPSKNSLSVDVATPQWHWQNGNVSYKPEPHLLLSMEQPQFLIGLRPTKPGNAKYVPVVKDWLENSLRSGIGSRVSSGYGRALGQPSTFLQSKSYSFELWTQGMYGADSRKVEFRPTALRGILRYWFRAVALSFYEPSVCQTLEDTIFGKLSQQGKVSINVIYNLSSRKNPYRYDGNIVLEAKDKQYLNLLEKLLILASHLGGFGRGSRRPLHFLDVDGQGYIRGCHWTIDVEATLLEFNFEIWKQLFEQIRVVFTAIQSPITSRNSSPGSPDKGKRRQDVLDANTQIWLVKSSNQISPDKVSDWSTEGFTDNVRGTALSLFYGDDRFKGRNKAGQGNSNVGGTLGTPSFVWIKSIFPNSGDPYQVVTVFGIDQADRLTFAQELDKLAKKKPSEAILVFGKMPAGNSPQFNRPIRR